jgi:hypothetical protein
MVSNNEIYPIVRGIWNLSSLHMESAMATSSLVKKVVKGDKGIVSSIKVIEMLVSLIMQNHPALTDTHDEIKSWLDLLDKEYDDLKFTKFKKNIHLKINHANKLKNDTTRWFEAIYEVYQKSNTKLINEDKLREYVISLKKKLDEMESKDLLDSYHCLVNNIPTPAAMMLYRIGESMVRKFYSKEMKKQPHDGATMGTMAQELRKKQTEEIERKIRKKADPLVNYIIVQTEERNLAQHPERRFEQTEAEEVFIFVKKLIIDIDDRLKV